MIKVTVVMPAYNVAKFIEGAVDSVLAQTYTNFELVIVNDGSTDDTARIIGAYRDSRVRIVTQKNRGLAGARNTGIRVANGEYIALLDADDLWHPDKLCEHVAHLDDNPEVGVSYSASRFMDESGRLLSIYQAPRLDSIEPADVLCRNPVGNGSAPVIRMATFRDIEKLDDRYGDPEPVYFDPDFRQSEDIECWVRIAGTTNWRFAGLAQALTLYRLNSGGLSASVDRQLASWEAFIAKAESYAPQLIQEWGDLARAYQYRYLSRRALWSQETRTARRLFLAALKSNWRIALYEPARTCATAIALLLQTVMPLPAYQLIEKSALAARRLARA